MKLSASYFPFCPLAVFFIVIVFVFQVQAQTVPVAGVTITQAIPASPDAAALGKYGNIPVSAYTGIPNISIPLYTIKSGDLSLPVSLSYHSGGNKIEEMASSVGLGWVLNAGGAITRTIKGKPDEGLNGFLTQNSAATISSYLNSSNLTTAQQQTLDLLLNQTADGTIDSEPDMYSYNFAGYSGKFVMDGNGNCYVIPLQDIKFTFSIENGQTTYVKSFTAQTPDGVKYYFNAVEFSSTSGSNVQNAVSWFLTGITSPSGHTINLTYTAEAYDFSIAPTQTLYQWIGSVNNVVPSTGVPPAPSPVLPQSATTVFNNVKLSTITFDNGSLQIFANINRQDLNSINSPTGAKAIDSIAITGANFTKLYTFYYTNQASARLRLDSLVGQLPSASGAGNAGEKYSFTYNADPWTNNANFMKLFSQDWWGYYNGHGNALNNLGCLVPANLTYISTYQPFEAIPLPGANRAPDETSMLGGMLTRITYPTGGYSVFTYEANEEYNVNLQGTSPKYPLTANEAAFSNNPASSYYNYDINNNNASNSFTINVAASVVVPVNVHARGLAGPNGPPPPPSVDYIQSQIVQGSTAVYTITNTDTTIYLPAGNYQITLLDNKGQAYNPTTNPNGVLYEVAVSYSGYSQATFQAMTNNYIAGGLRIQQIADYDGVHNTPVNQRNYSYLLPGTTVSSGWLDFQPLYGYELDIETSFLPAGGTIPANAVNAYYTRTSTSNYPFTTTQGSVVGYSHVQETYGSNGQNGMNEYFYTNSQTNPDLQNGVAAFPFPPAVDQDWHRGLLLKETQWKQAGNGTYSKVGEKVKNYSTININTTSSVGIKAGFTPKPDPSTYSEHTSYYTNPPLNEFARVKVVPYNNYTDYTYVSSDTTRTYNLSDQTKYVQTWDNYQFDPVTYQLTQLQSLDSKGETITQTVNYPDHYTITGSPTSTALLGILNLQNQGIIDVPIEEITRKQNAGGINLRTVKAVLTTYKPTVPYRDSVYEMRSVTPVTGFANSSAGTNSIVKDPSYQPVVSFDKYDAYGNIMQERKVSDALHCYIWGYYNPVTIPTLPVAEVINANSSDIAYTNFESYPAGGNGSGNWVYSNTGTSLDQTAPMGASCYALSGANTIAKTGLNTAVTYIVSFWAKSGSAVTVSGGTVSSIATGNAKSGWQYYEYNVKGTSSVTIGGSGYADELRLYPLNAQMSTFTYVPLVGIASKCDAKNDITYYNYDSAGRLSFIQDQNRNIIKSYNYNYQGQ